jgi:TonB family protein
VIIGNHYPEFSHEKDLDNLKNAITELGIEYAVAQDNDGKTWRAYNNRYWPTMYLIDKKGNIEKAEILKSVPMLDEAALAAAWQLKFTPGKQRDRFVKVWMAVPFNFTYANR